MSLVEALAATPSGRWEGTPKWEPYYWAFVLEGLSTWVEGEDEAFCLVVTPEERAAFPELAGVAYVRLWESEDGVVYADLLEVV